VVEIARCKDQRFRTASSRMLPPEVGEFLQVCAVDYGVDPDSDLARVIDVMEVPGCSGSVLRSACSLRDLRQGEREDEFVFLRKVTVEVRKTLERIA
jgi:hypothetical protein